MPRPILSSGGHLKWATAQINKPGPTFTCKAGFCCHSQMQICRAKSLMEMEVPKPERACLTKSPKGLTIPSHLQHSQVNQNRSYKSVSEKPANTPKEMTKHQTQTGSTRGKLASHTGSQRKAPRTQFGLGALPCHIAPLPLRTCSH